MGDSALSSSTLYLYNNHSRRRCYQPSAMFCRFWVIYKMKVMSTSRHLALWGHGYAPGKSEVRGWG